MDKQVEKKEISINEMVEKYNSLEAEAFGLLMQIFYKIKKERTNYRDIRFSNGEVLSNCFGSPDRLDRNLYLHKFERAITNIREGEKKV